MLGKKSRHLEAGIGAVVVAGAQEGCIARLQAQPQGSQRFCRWERNLNQYD